MTDPSRMFRHFASSQQDWNCIIFKTAGQHCFDTSNAQQINIQECKSGMKQYQINFLTHLSASPPPWWSGFSKHVGGHTWETREDKKERNDFWWQLNIQGVCIACIPGNVDMKNTFKAKVQSRADKLVEIHRVQRHSFDILNWADKLVEIHRVQRHSFDILNWLVVLNVLADPDCRTCNSSVLLCLS